MARPHRITSQVILWERDGLRLRRSQHAFAPRARDGERDAGALEVREHPVPVLGLEAGTRPLGAREVTGEALRPRQDDVVLSELEDLTLGAEPVEVLPPASVLTEDQPT